MQDRVLESRRAPPQAQAAGRSVEGPKHAQLSALSAALNVRAAQRMPARPTQRQPNRTGLPDPLKAGVEGLSGVSMEDVRVHRNSDKPEHLNALAYAQGNEIHLAPGQEKHLPHEAWHVAQQAQGRVKPTMQMKGMGINDDLGLEREADVMGKAAAGRASEPHKLADGGEVAIAGRGKIAQLLKVDDTHVKDDVRHPKRETLFEAHTLEDLATRAGGAVHANFPANPALIAAVHASREDGMMDYRQLSQRKVTSEKQLLAFLNESEDDEHMYVLEDGELHVAIRAESKKLPHPTLVGGDPDVECAGTMRKDTENNVVVTASSGHFRPPSEAPGQKAVDKIMNKTSSKQFSKKVKGSKR